MAVSVQGGAKSRRGSRRGSSFSPRAEINVTPMVDVMLVLLIVFMVSAPLLATGVPLDLPKTEAKALPAGDQEPLTISVTADGGIYVQETEYSLEELAPKLRAVADARGGGLNERIFLRGDDSVGYGEVMTVMARVSAAGFTRVGLVTDPLTTQ